MEPLICRTGRPAYFRESLVVDDRTRCGEGGAGGVDESFDDWEVVPLFDAVTDGDEEAGLTDVDDPSRDLLNAGHREANRVFVGGEVEGRDIDVVDVVGSLPLAVTEGDDVRALVNAPNERFYSRPAL